MVKISLHLHPKEQPFMHRNIPVNMDDLIQVARHVVACACHPFYSHTNPQRAFQTLNESSRLRWALLYFQDFSSPYKLIIYIYLYTAKVAQKMGITYVFRNIINKRWCMLNKQTCESWSDMTWLVLNFWEELDPKKKRNQWSLYLSHHQWHVSTCRCHPVQSKYANITSSPSWLALPSALSDSSSAILLRISCSKWTNLLWALRLPQTNTLQ